MGNYMSNPDQFILDFYRDVAQRFGHSSQSTMKDHVIRRAEEEFFIEEIKRYMKERNPRPVIADMGCGNGHLLKVLRETFPQCELMGIEFTPELYELAVAREIPRCVILQGDIRDPKALPTKADVIITERVLINLLSDNDKQKAAQAIAQQLSVQGRLLMSESFLESWRKLNTARREVKLSPIPQSKQNRYMLEYDIQDYFPLGFVELKGIFSPHHLSTHFYFSRIYHHLMRPEGGQLQETEFVDFFDEAIGPGIGQYSPIQFRVLEKIV